METCKRVIRALGDVVCQGLVLVAALSLVIPLQVFGHRGPGQMPQANDDSVGRSDHRRADRCDGDLDTPGKIKHRDRKCPPLGSSSGIARGDFNDDGFGDLAIGVPFEDVEAATGLPRFDAGAVNVIYGSAGGLSRGGLPVGVPANQFWHQGRLGPATELEPTDTFGSALASGDFNGDGVSDLAVGVPGEDGGRGAVQVMFGTPGPFGGLTPASTQLFRAAEFGLGIARFGTSLTWGTFDGDTISDLAIGATGSLIVLRGSATGLTGTGFQRQDIPGFLVLAAGNFNGDTMSDLAIGTPNETIVNPVTGDPIAAAGVVRIFEGSPIGLDLATTQVITQFDLSTSDGAQTNDHFGSALAAGDFNCNGVSDLAIGVPGEGLADAVGNILVNAGAVGVVYSNGSGLSTAGNQFWHQALGAGGVPGRLESDDAFGATLAAGDFNGTCTDLAVGVPFEDFDENTPVVQNSGAVNVIFGSGSGLTTVATNFVPAPAFFNENVAGIADRAERDDAFGSALTAWDFNGDGVADLAIGVPFQEITRTDGVILVDAGQVQVLNGRRATQSLCCPIIFNPGGFATTSRLFNQNSTGIQDSAEAGDRFGSAVY